MSLLTLLYKYRKKDAFINAFINFIEQAVRYPIQAQHMRFEPSRWHILAIDTLFTSNTIKRDENVLWDRGIRVVSVVT